MKKYDGVMKRARELEEKNGIKYAKISGKLYKTIDFFYLLCGIWIVLMNAFYIIGQVVFYSDKGNIDKHLNSIVTVSVCSGVMIAGYLFVRFKKQIIGAVLTVVSAAMLVSVFANYLADDSASLGYKPSFYLRHFAPAVILAALVIWLTVIAVRERVKTDRQYRKVAENLYNMHTSLLADGNSDMTDEQWDEFLANYDPDQQKKR